MKILLISGGNDSLYLFNKDKYDSLIYFDYGQPYLKEEMKRLPKETQIVKIPHLKIRQDGFVKGRNLIFLTEIAKIFDKAVIFIGTNKNDTFQDNNLKFYRKAIRIINKAFDTKLRVRLPLREIPKSEIVKFIKENNIDTYSCYKGEEDPCGVCKACREVND